MIEKNFVVDPKQLKFYNFIFIVIIIVKFELNCSRIRINNDWTLQ